MEQFGIKDQRMLCPTGFTKRAYCAKICCRGKSDNYRNPSSVSVCRINTITIKREIY